MTSSAPKKILVANRGEIALRIMRSIKELGHIPFAIYSEADAKSPHVAFSHQAFCVGPAPSSESYLQADTILDICKREKIDAIHPGYGFMAENKIFAEKCAKANVAFIGPLPDTIEQMGDKILARRAAEKAGLPMVPGSHNLKDAAEATAFAEKIGYPVLLKAKAGGGGKGMRKVSKAEEIEEAFRLAQSEAQKAFGDGALYMEKCLVHPRHIEVQVFCDHHGNVYTLGDRECSIQRRHQKIIEEAPAFGLSETLRQKMSDVSKALCQQVNYHGAGTIEYLVDENQNFYFLEMNTRLQVEHPVTELVTQLDLVALQIRAAFGEKILIDPKITGHAIEVRIYAEDPALNFIPQPGMIEQIIWPTGPGIRIDSGIESRSEISLYYDPMIAKISTFAQNRAHAIEKMKWALSETIIVGTKTNKEFLQDILCNKDYEKNNVSTTFVEENMPFASYRDISEVELAACFATLFSSDASLAKVHSKASMWWTSRLPRFQWYK
ncbi:MAG: ATP-grasp domain-containing protein [Bdellovibrionales bacterium]|nr:ATP-grasp domain-containing protein [Bdellovibrionales bacterium]